jgi:hypothetical protein
VESRKTLGQSRPWLHESKKDKKKKKLRKREIRNWTRISCCVSTLGSN